VKTKPCLSVVTLSLIALLLACGLAAAQDQVARRPTAIPVAATAVHPQTFTSLLSFDGTDGAGPITSVIQGTDGNFYGTTAGGGSFSNGTVFQISSQLPYTLTTLYNFCSQANCTDGAGAEGGLLLATDGNFYGTTYSGGANGYGGTVFSITPSGALTTLHSFCNLTNCADGGFPYYGSLVQGIDGNFYGTNGLYGAQQYGTVFKITPLGNSTTLYSFCRLTNCADGAAPLTGLVQASDGNFYGTTVAGGANSSPFCGVDCGTVFRITPGGMLTTLYSFCALQNCADGAFPLAGLLLAADGNLYGTTVRGGVMGNCPSGSVQGCGTIFKITLSGALSTLYTFCAQGNCPDGADPYAALMQATDGNFYGTTFDGGANATGGTVFSITPSGVLTTLYSFCSLANCADGADPYGGSLQQGTDGNFYGATTDGGLYDYCLTNGNPGCGTLFSLSVGLGPFVATLPTSSVQGRPVTILGNNLTGSTSVTFNGTPASFQVVSNTEIKTTVPKGATTGAVRVTTPGGVLVSNTNFRIWQVLRCNVCINTN